MKILIAEDDEISRLILQNMLVDLGFEMVVARDGAEALEYIAENEIRLIVTDWMMPRVDGLELCRRIRARSSDSPYTYIIILTAKHLREDRLNALKAGADDYLTKPIDKADLQARILVAQRIITMEEQIRSRTIELERIQLELEYRNSQLSELASSDGLTGLKNHRFFRESLEAHFSLARRRELPMSLVMIDVDQFKPYNDNFGHPAGDLVLRDVAWLLRSSVREHDVVARYGGEEFAVLLPASDTDGSRSLAERLRVAVEKHQWPNRPITISLGVVTMNPRISRAADLVDLADKSLYRSKAAGRNRVTHAVDMAMKLTMPDPRRPLATVPEDGPEDLAYAPMGG